jgi:hypothetical protein
VYDVGDVEYEFIEKNCNQYFFVLRIFLIILLKILTNIYRDTHTHTNIDTCIQAYTALVYAWYLLANNNCRLALGDKKKRWRRNRLDKLDNTKHHWFGVLWREET